MSPSAAGPIRIATRRSRLALVQAEEVAAALRARGRSVQLVPMVTSGDEPAAPRGDRFGVKGLFVAEIVAAVREGRADLAVHSAKDLPAEDPEGLVVAAVPRRADPRDVLVSRTTGDLPSGAVVGTSSLRRIALLARTRRDLEARPVRGNVETRLAKLDAGEVDGILLASAGLARLGLAPSHARPLSPQEMLPAPGQGALAVQARSADPELLAALAPLEHAPSRLAFDAERALVALLGGGCSLPLGALAEPGPGGVRLRAVVAEVDGSASVEADASGDDPRQVAVEVATRLLDAGAGAILARAVGGAG